MDEESNGRSKPRPVMLSTGKEEIFRRLEAMGLVFHGYPPLAHLPKIGPMFTAFVTVTPEFARLAIADPEATNREVNKNRVAQMAKDMLGGEFYTNGEAVILDSNLKLVDGQQRFHSCVQANLPFTTNMSVGIPREYIHTIDSGKRRTPADTLNIDSKIKTGKRATRAVVRAATLRYLKAYYEQEGRIWNVGPRLTSAELLSVNEAHPIADESLVQGHNCHIAVKQNPSLLSAINHVLRQVHPGMVDQMYQDLVDGTNMVTGYPTLTLRNKLTKQIKNKAYTAQALYLDFVIAWGYLCRGEFSEKLRGTGKLQKTDAPPEIAVPNERGLAQLAGRQRLKEN